MWFQIYKTLETVSEVINFEISWGSMPPDSMHSLGTLPHVKIPPLWKNPVLWTAANKFSNLYNTSIVASNMYRSPFLSRSWQNRNIIIQKIKACYADFLVSVIAG
jgi:hypothetical protein